MEEDRILTRTRSPLLSGWLRAATSCLALVALTSCQGQPTALPTPDAGVPTETLPAPTATPTPEPSPTPTATAPVAFSSPLELHSPVPTPISPVATPTFPRPASGKAALRGGLYSPIMKEPIAGTYFYLTPGVGEHSDQMPPLLKGAGPYDIPGHTDEQGWLALDNIPPGTYYMVIWAPLAWDVLETVEGSAVAPMPLRLEAGKVLDLGEVSVNWP